MRVAEVEGRQDDDFRYEGVGVVPASVFRHALGSDPSISEYQVRQTANGADVLLVGSPDLEAVRSALFASLAQHGLTDPAIRVTVVPRIERHEATGKLKRFVALAH
jgi:phenylacetate-coenzyme A ligase PaaK-like adenylate-forming protein